MKGGGAKSEHFKIDNAALAFIFPVCLFVCPICVFQSVCQMLTWIESCQFPESIHKIMFPKSQASRSQQI